MDARGIDTDKYLRRFGLSKKILTDDKAVISKKYHVWELLACVTQQEGIDNFGFSLNYRQMFQKMGHLQVALGRATTLYEAILFTCDAVLCHLQNEQVRFRTEGKVTHVDFIRLDHGYCTTHEQLAIKFILLLLELLPKQEDSPEISLISNEPNSRDFTMELGNSIQFNSNKTRITLPSHFLSLPIVLPTFNEINTQTIEGELSRLSLSESLRSIIDSVLKYSYTVPTVFDAAQMVGVDRKTLYEHLQKEGTSFNKITKDARYQRSFYLLTETELQIKEVAQLVGYSNQNNFCRAFARLSGMSPSKVRQLHTT